ncbi:site-specific integrase [Roseococcus sp. YIM B11640]|uniref:site-specific integrase n=1 Tax=Roseococcus sp. YIM B11640 TaxID=3133973 RepID=UPI003C7D1D65
MRINKRAIEDLDRQPLPETRQVFWDDKLAGFGLRRTPKGKIAYVLKYRVRGDVRQRFETLGDWPAMLPDDARAEAEEFRSAASRGRDLAAERDAAAKAERQAALDESRRAIPITELLDGWRAATQAALASRIAAEQTGSYERELLRLEAQILRPSIGATTVGAFDPAQFKTLLASQASASTAGNLRSLILRFSAHVSEEMDRRGMPISWPDSYKLKKGRGQRWQRYTLDEIARLFIAAGAFGRRGALLRFMILTACRKSEGVRAKRSRIVLDDAVVGPYWLQIGGTTKNRQEHRVPLSPAAVALLRWLPDRSTRTTPETDLIFSGRGGKVMSSWSDLATSVFSAAGIAGRTFHDFRRTVVSVLGDHGFDAVVTDKLLNHAASSSMTGVMAVYQRAEMLALQRQAIERWAELLFAEIDRQGAANGKPQISRETWGFDVPFEEARIRRLVQPRRAVAAAPRSSGSRRRATS